MKVFALRNKTEESFGVGYDTQAQIQTYGRDNQYPQMLHRIIQSSPTGSGCLERYATFIEGDGFANLAFAEMVVNHKGETVDSLHSLICKDYAEYGGFAIHVNYNALGQIVEMQHVPFEQTRLSYEDDRGFVPFIMVHETWTAHKRRHKKNGDIRVELVKDCDTIHRFNPLREVVMAEIEACGGIDFYKGQIFWYSNMGENAYPVPRADRVATSMSTDEGLCNMQWRNVRNNFFPAGMLYVKKGQGGPYAPAGTEYNRGSSSDGWQADFADSIRQAQGDTKACKVVVVELESDDDKPIWEPMNSTNYDKEFTVTEESTTARIYSAFHQEPWYCIKNGKVGFSGDILTDAYDYYNSVVTKERRVIERSFDTLMKHWGGFNPGDDHSVKPLVYISNANRATSI